MSILKLIFGELRFRKTHGLLNLFAATLAVALFVALPTLIESYGRESSRSLQAMQDKFTEESASYKDETRKIMLKMGFNLKILHKDTNLAELYSRDFTTAHMPYEYAHTLAESPLLTLANHILATLNEKIEWEGQPVLLKGYEKEIPQPHRKKQSKNLRPIIEKGTAFLGFHLGKGREEGDEITIRDRSRVG